MPTLCMQRPRFEPFGAPTVLGLHSSGAVIGISQVLHAQTPSEGDRYAMARLAELLTQPGEDITAFIFKLPGNDLRLRALLEEVARKRGVGSSELQRFAEILNRVTEVPDRRLNLEERILLRQLQDFLGVVGNAILALTATNYLL